jgi:DNA gyrase subunit B
VDVTLQYNDSYNAQLMGYTNTINNPDGGTHIAGFRSALTQSILSTPKLPLFDFTFW